MLQTSDENIDMSVALGCQTGVYKNIILTILKNNRNLENVLPVAWQHWCRRSRLTRGKDAAGILLGGECGWPAR